jgi:hypothetical protein
MIGHLQEEARAVSFTGSPRVAMSRDEMNSSVATVDFWRKIRQLGSSHSMTYRLPNARKSNLATEPVQSHLFSRSGHSLWPTKGHVRSADILGSIIA